MGNDEPARDASFPELEASLYSGSEKKEVCIRLRWVLLPLKPKAKRSLKRLADMQSQAFRSR